MKKLAANYLISETGKLLKNGILLAEDNGVALDFIDTNGDLDEIAQLTFHNGILIAGQTFARIDSGNQAFISPTIQGKDQLSLHDLVELAKQYQIQFPEMQIPEIWNAINTILQPEFRKETTAGIFLLIGSDLPGLHFTSKSRLKKIL